MRDILRRKRKQYFCLVISLSFLIFFNLSCSKTPPPDYSVLLITIDTLRSDHLGCYGNNNGCSPNIDKLAESGARFSNAWSQTNSTLPSHISILTSSYIQDHGVFTNDVIYKAGLPGLDGILKKAGLRTCAIVSVIHLGKTIGLDGAFDDYYDMRTNPAKVPAFQGKSRDADETTDIAIKWLKKHGKKPFFLWVHYFDPHMPYYPPEPYRSRLYPGQLPERIALAFKLIKGQVALEEVLSSKEWTEPEISYFTAVSRMGLPLNEFHYNGIGITEQEFEALNGLYDGEIAFVDAEIGRLFDFMEESGIRDKTLSVLTSDHGESIGEHQIIASHRSLYSPTIRVPLIFSWAGKIPEGVVSEMPVQTLDIAPTILNLTSNQVPDSYKGINLQKYLAGKPSTDEQDERLLRFEHANTGAIGLLQNNWKWIVSLEDQFELESTVYRHRPKELYNLAEDPDELNDLVRIAAENGADNLEPDFEKIDSNFTSEFRSWYDSAGLHRIRGSKRVEDGELKESLRALGYVQ